MSKHRAWTYSHLSGFETCPRQFHEMKVLRNFPDPPTEATIWGQRVHSAFEDAINDGTPLPEGMTKWQGIADKLIALRGTKWAERKMALDRNFSPVDFDSAEAWTRGIADLVVVRGRKAVVFDYKTGRRKPSEQLDLYAAYVFAVHPEVDSVRTAFVWLKDRKIDWCPGVGFYPREHLPVLWQSLLPRVIKLETAYTRDSWPARSSGLCRGWCAVTTCEFHQPKR